MGIFHPYYVAQLAPFTAALAGAGVGTVLRGGRAALLLGPLALAGGVATELAVVESTGSEIGWVAPAVAAAVVVAGAALALGHEARLRRAGLALGVAALLARPAALSVQTLGHATSGTFPAGGPATSATGAPGGGNVMAAAPQGGGGFGGAASALSEALAYAAANGGGTVAVSSQSGAASALIDSGADVVALGGFSGRESEIDAAWLAERVESGEIRYVLTESGDGGSRAGTEGQAPCPSAPGTEGQAPCPSAPGTEGQAPCPRPPARAPRATAAPGARPS